MTSQIKTKNSVYVKIISFFLVLTIGAIFLILHFALSKATITIFSRNEDQNKQIIIALQAENTGSVSNDALIGKIINVDLELEASAPSNSESIPAEYAGGTVTIINNYSKDQTLVKTTRLLSTTGKIYRIAENVNVPSKGQIKVWAEADQAGSDYVSEPLDKMTIPGLWPQLQDQIFAQAPDGFKQESRPGYNVSKENIDTAQNNLLAEAKKQGLEKINELLTGDLKIDENRLFIKQEILSSSAVGDNSQSAKIKEKINIYGLVFSVADLYKLAENKFTSQLASDQSILEFAPDNYSYQISEIDLEKNEAIIEVNLAAKIKTSSHPWLIDKEKLVGLNAEQIKEYLQGEFSISEAEVKFFPFWVKTAPKLKDHIIIE
jgi:hypothetical protein